MIKKYKVFGFSLALSAAIYFFLFGQENFQKLNFQKDLQLNFIDNASFEEKKNKIDSIINLSNNNPAQVYFLANYLFDKTEYALASRTLEHFILNFPNDTDAEVIALTAETKYLSNNQIFYLIYFYDKQHRLQNKSMLHLIFAMLYLYHHQNQ